MVIIHNVKISEFAALVELATGNKCPFYKLCTYSKFSAFIYHAKSHDVEAVNIIVKLLTAAERCVQEHS